MEPIYLSYYLEENTPLYGGIRNLISIKQNSSIDNGNTSNDLIISFPNHSGTHIDFPYHFCNKGKKCSDYPAPFWIFNKIGFLDCSIEEVPEGICHLSKDIELLILKTGFGEMRGDEIFWKAQPVIPANFAALFRATFPNLRVFGFDLISLTSKLNRTEGKNAHSSFLIENDILVIEDMNLSRLTCTPDNVIVSPLQIGIADGVPCTIISY